MENYKHEIELFGRKYTYASVEDYLSVHRGRGASFTNRKLGLKYYMLKNCLSVCQIGQLLMPLENAEDDLLIFKESYAYNHDDNVRKAQIYDFSNHQEDLIQLEEAVPLYHVWSNNFWHWTLECLPKLLALEDQGYTGKYIVFKSEFIVTSLKLFNISADRICFSDRNYLVKNLIIPPMYEGGDCGKTLLIEYLRGKLLDAVGILQGNKRIYVKRTTGRTVLNEDEVMDILRKYDFDIMVPEEYPVGEQFTLMTNVDFSIMAHGANCTLTLTQKMNSTFMELFSNAYIPYNLVNIIKTLNFNYIPLTEKRMDRIVPAGDESPQKCNIIVPIDVFETIIDNVSKKIVGK